MVLASMCVKPAVRFGGVRWDFARNECFHSALGGERLILSLPVSGFGGARGRPVASVFYALQFGLNAAVLS